MTKQTKILIVLGLGVGAYLLWKSKQPKKSFANANGGICPTYPNNAVGQAIIIGKDKMGYPVFMDSNKTYFYIIKGIDSKGQKWCTYTASNGNPLQRLKPKDF